MSKVTKRPFTIEEDKKLIQFVCINGPRNWGHLARQLTNRTPKQCRERWNNQLNPNINKGPWTQEEDIILAEKQRQLGNRWAEIARFLPGRTDTLVKNRWNTSVKYRAQDVLGETNKEEDNLKKWLLEISKKDPSQPQMPNFRCSSIPGMDFMTLPPLVQSKQ